MLKKLILELIKSVEFIGLSEIELTTSKEFLENQEYGLAFDTIITQLYEHEIKIDVFIFSLINRIAKRMNLAEEDYIFIKELIK